MGKYYLDLDRTSPCSYSRVREDNEYHSMPARKIGLPDVLGFNDGDGRVFRCGGLKGCTHQQLVLEIAIDGAVDSHHKQWS